jgi:cytochrome c
MKQAKFQSACLAGSLLVMGICGAVAQQARSAADGVYTAAQATRGKALYFDNCALCHGGELQGEEDNPPLTGAPFMKHWGGAPVNGLFGFINRTMPPGNGGTLGAGADADIVAYLLSQNNFPAGQEELPPDPTALTAITINKP